MAHMFARGAMVASSWHRKEQICEMHTAEDMIDTAEELGAWPVELRFEDLFTANGVKAPQQAVVGTYRQHPEAVLGVVGDRYRATTPEEWRSLVTAACAAGATPDGAYSLCDGTKVLATFDVGGNGIRTKFIMCDNFSGQFKLVAGSTSIRVVCQNTLSGSLRADGDGMQFLRHTKSLEEKVKVLKEAIEKSIKTGALVKETFEQASRIWLPPPVAKAVFDKLFPMPEEGASKAAVTRAENVRAEAMAAAKLPINKVGERPRNLATLWNAATYIVDRTLDGQVRPTRGGADALDSLLFGTRAKRLDEVAKVIQVVMADGSLQQMDYTEAREHGVDDRQIGRQIIADLLDLN